MAPGNGQGSEAALGGRSPGAGFLERGPLLAVTPNKEDATDLDNFDTALSPNSATRTSARQLERPTGNRRRVPFVAVGAVAALSGCTLVWYAAGRTAGLKNPAHGGAPNRPLPLEAMANQDEIVTKSLQSILPAPAVGTAEAQRVVNAESGDGEQQEGSRDDGGGSLHTASAMVAQELAKEEDNSCAGTGATCLESRCCKEPGHRCYSKDGYWAQCMIECIPGPNPMDQVSPMPWQCKPLGIRTPGKAKVCVGPGEDCRKSGCCTEGGTQCYEKNEFWAMCKPYCDPGPDLFAKDWKPWTCKALGPKTMGAAPWVAQQCSPVGQDCRERHCCAEPGTQCFRQNQFWASCRASCTKGERLHQSDPEWECAELGPRTPLLAEGGKHPVGKVQPWVVEHCSADWENCLHTGCCHSVGTRCYKRDEDFAACKETCSTEPDPDSDDNTTWDCQALGPPSIGLAIKGYPSLFCFSLYMPGSYEFGLLQAQLKAVAGIFDCDGYDLFANVNSTLGLAEDGTEVEATLIPTISVGVSQDGTAGNAKLFMAVWDKVIAAARFRSYDFTLKVDPDAVLVPWRIRSHMAPHVGQKVYVVNCNKFPGSPNFPMMFGAVEIFSQPAMIQYAYNSWKCGQQLPWASWGEDFYMTKCMDFVGVGRIGDFGVLGDNMCTGANCFDTYTASFHPFKSVDGWFQCWGQATKASPPAR